MGGDVVSVYDIVLCVLSCVAQVFSSMYLLSPYLCFISFLYLDLYVLEDDSWISLSPPVIFLLTVPRWILFSLCLSLLYCLVCVM